MYFDKTTVLSLIKTNMTNSDRKKTTIIDNAMLAALAELSMRLKSQSSITSYTVALSSTDREVTLKGGNDDLRYIFALKIGSGSDERLLDYKDIETFLREHDDADVSVGKPTIYTQIKSDNGFPVIRFSHPLDTAETLTVYYYLEITPDNMSFMRSVSAVVAGTLAYFFGTASDAGLGYYEQFKELASLSRASDDFHANKPTEIGLSYQDHILRSTVNAMAKARR